MILLSENVSQWDLYVANEILWIQCLATMFTGVALCTGVATAEIHQQVLSHVSKTSRSEVGPGVVR
jgi:hypothetical protein